MSSPMFDPSQQGFSSDPQEAQPQDTPAAQGNNAAMAGMMTMLRAFATLANQSPGIAMPLAGQFNPTPSFPAFISTDQSSAGKSLTALFPTIETSTLLDIAQHEFRPMDLCKLDPASKFQHAIRRFIPYSSLCQHTSSSSKLLQLPLVTRTLPL
ncbi:hypothetical protein C0992_012910 [Termitomyces sp. T32_za158]|nr:hypothetical protein C0992_012910 [Termitomyces sp. T32_za158]